MVRDADCVGVGVRGGVKVPEVLAVGVGGGVMEMDTLFESDVDTESVTDREGVCVPQIAS